MRKTRSRYNQAPIKVEAEHKDEDKVVPTATPTKRRKKKADVEKQSSELSSTGCQISSTSGNAKAVNDINEEKSVVSKKPAKASIKRLKPRKVSTNPKKEFSKSNFCMTKILQNNSPKDSGSLKGKSLPLRKVPEGLLVPPVPKDEDEKAYLPAKIFIKFMP